VSRRPVSRSSFMLLMHSSSQNIRATWLQTRASSLGALCKVRTRVSAIVAIPCVRANSVVMDAIAPTTSMCTSAETFEDCEL
jgi:hypothetical protein